MLIRVHRRPIYALYCTGNITVLLSTPLTVTFSVTVPVTELSRRNCAASIPKRPGAANIAVNSNPNVSLRVTSNGSTLNELNCAYITADPAMPQIAASIVANDGTSVTGTATWQINTTFQHKKRDPSTNALWWETDTNSTPSSPLSLAANQAWQPAFQSVFGGNATVKWTYNGQEQPPFNFYVCGTNPDYGTVVGVLDAMPYWFARKIASRESNMSQFCESGRMDVNYCIASKNHFGWPVLVLLR
jgi:hypothetical protein